MTKRILGYQLAELKLEDFITIPSLNVAIAKTKTRTADGKVLTRISWYVTKLLIQRLGSNYFLPTSAQWNKAREYLQQNYPELEKDFISGEYEWLDSLLAFPNADGNYSSRLQISSIKKGRVPLLIEQSKVERSDNGYVITDGKVTEVPELPLKDGYIQDWDEDLGLPTKVGENSNKKFKGAYFCIDTDYNYHEGLRALVHGTWVLRGHERRFITLADWFPYDAHCDVGFRLGRTVSADKEFVRMPRAEYEKLSKLSKELNELLSRVIF